MYRDSIDIFEIWVLSSALRCWTTFPTCWFSVSVWGIVCHHQRVSWQGEACALGGGFEKKNTFECLWFTSPVASTFTRTCNYLIEDVNNNIYSHVIRTSAISLQMFLFLHLHRQKVQPWSHFKPAEWGILAFQKVTTAHHSSIRPAEWLSTESKTSLRTLLGIKPARIWIHVCWGLQQINISIPEKRNICCL